MPPRAVALLALALGAARAQIYTFEEVPVPDVRSLHTKYAFYIYSYQDAPERTLGRPFVKFHGLVAHSTDPKTPDEKLSDYRGVQMCLVPYRDFWKRITPSKFCSTQNDVGQKVAKRPDELLVTAPRGVSYEDLHIYLNTVRFPASSNWHPKDKQATVRSSAVYILTFSNCGEVKAATVSGSIIVKNSYGFLPGNEYHKMPFYGWLSLVYTAMALAWTGLSFRWWRELFHIQYCIAVVILLGLLEAFMWWIFFNDWNHTGLRGRLLFIMATLSSVIKSIFSYMLVLVASLGWGITRPYLDHRTIMKVQALSFLYIVLDFIRESVLSFRHSHSLSLSFTLLCLLPVALLNGMIFYWIFTALSSLMETLKERRQTEKLQLFERLWKILITALLFASVTLLFQIFDLSRSISLRWHYQWFITDGVSHIIFLLVLAAIMYLWAPNMNSQRYAYSRQVGVEEQEGAKAEGTVWADEGLEDEEGEDESFWATTHKAGEGKPTKITPAPDTIGGAAEGEAEAAGERA